MNPETPPAQQAPVPAGSSFWETVRFVLLAAIIVIPIRLFVAQPFIVDGLSMYPTFGNRDYLIVDELSYRFKDPARGDVLVFQYPRSAEGRGLPSDEILHQAHHRPAGRDRDRESRRGHRDQERRAS